ncbi:MAG: photosystem I reaction center subunit IV [Hahellaceae bacterium]|nr:photosystem I reaction center subunit IV [Hahellaceae bacterium]
MRQGLKNLVIRFTACAALSIVAVPGFALQDVLESKAMTTEKAPSSLLLDVVKAGNRLVAVGERGHIIFSDNQGKTWRQASVPVSVTLTAVHFPSQTQGWAVGHGAVILHSADAGETWEKQFDGNVANEVVIGAAQRNVAALEKALDSASDDKKSKLEAALDEANFALDDAKADSEAGASKPLLDVWFKNDKEGFVVGAYGFFFSTKDGGSTWENAAPRIANPDRFHLNAMNQVTGGAVFIAGEAGVLFRSVDGGENWVTLESPYEGSLFGVAGNGNVNEVTIYGLRGHLFRSVDMGDSWSGVDSGTESSLMGSFASSDGSMYVVGNSGTILVSGNAGESFKSRVREDRVSLMSGIMLEDDSLILVGENGVVIADSQGRSK